LKPKGNFLTVEEPDPEVHYFYLSHLTGTKKRDGFQEQIGIWDEEREMPLPSLYPRSAGLNSALNKTRAFLQGETRNTGANNISTFDQNRFYSNMEML